MPDNPHKSAEERLREYSQLRKGKLGEGVKLSDTRRQLLLQEVEEKYNSREDSTWILVYRSIWGKIALAFCGLLILGILLNNIIFNEKHSLSMAKRDKISEKQVPDTVSKTSDTENKSLIRSVPQPPKSLASVDALSEQPDKGVKAESANIAANVKMEKISSASNYQTLQKNVRLGGGPPKENIVLGSRMEPSFSSVTTGIGLAIAKTILPQNYTDLFNKFKIEIKDSKVLVTGEDGSIYNGEFVNDSNLEKMELVKKTIAAEQYNQQKLTESATTLLFNVKGTNKTLNKPIEFIGKFITDVQADERPVVARRGLNEQRLRLSAKLAGVKSSSERINNEQYYSKTANTIKIQTNIVILYLNSSTNLIIRAIMNQNGFYQRVTN